MINDCCINLNTEDTKTVSLDVMCIAASIQSRIFFQLMIPCQLLQEYSKYEDKHHYKQARRWVAIQKAEQLHLMTINILHHITIYIIYFLDVLTLFDLPDLISRCFFLRFFWFS